MIGAVAPKGALERFHDHGADVAGLVVQPNILQRAQKVAFFCESFL